MQRIPEPMEWLRHDMPLTLVIDLLDPLGPDSRRIMADEPADTDWIQPAVA